MCRTCRFVTQVYMCHVGLLLPSTQDRKSTRLNSSHLVISYAVFCLKKKRISCVTQTLHGFCRRLHLSRIALRIVLSIVGVIFTCLRTSVNLTSVKATAG